MDDLHTQKEHLPNLTSLREKTVSELFEDAVNEECLEEEGILQQFAHLGFSNEEAFEKMNPYEKVRENAGKYAEIDDADKQGLEEEEENEVLGQNRPHLDDIGFPEVEMLRTLSSQDDLGDETYESVNIGNIAHVNFDIVGLKSVDVVKSTDVDRQLQSDPTKVCSAVEQGDSIEDLLLEKSLNFLESLTNTESGGDSMSFELHLQSGDLKSILGVDNEARVIDEKVDANEMQSKFYSTAVIEDVTEQVVEDDIDVERDQFENDILETEELNDEDDHNDDLHEHGIKLQYDFNDSREENHNIFVAHELEASGGDDSVRPFEYNHNDTIFDESVIRSVNIEDDEDDNVVVKELFDYPYVLDSYVDCGEEDEDVDDDDDDDGDDDDDKDDDDDDEEGFNQNEDDEAGNYEDDDEENNDAEDEDSTSNNDSDEDEETENDEDGKLEINDHIQEPLHSQDVRARQTIKRPSRFQRGSQATQKFDVGYLIQNCIHKAVASIRDSTVTETEETVIGSRKKRRLDLLLQALQDKGMNNG